MTSFFDKIREIIDNHSKKRFEAMQPSKFDEIDHQLSKSKRQYTQIDNLLHELEGIAAQESNKATPFQMAEQSNSSLVIEPMEKSTDNIVSVQIPEQRTAEKISETLEPITVQDVSAESIASPPLKKISSDNESLLRQLQEVYALDEQDNSTKPVMLDRQPVFVPPDDDRKALQAAGFNIVDTEAAPKAKVGRLYLRIMKNDSRKDIISNLKEVYAE
ncbi:MAG TPA: hypothetical protein VJH97_06525 [Candidatus Nanoarchaeia archaeon]|nr:hypothetical protein [Candidatus Nanoarchaeia archaeon]